MALTKKATSKKKVSKKKATRAISTAKTAKAAALLKTTEVKRTPLSNSKLHVVLGRDLMGSYVDRCEQIGTNGMTKSEVGRLLCEAFANGSIKITPPKVTQLKAIKA